METQKDRIFKGKVGTRLIELTKNELILKKNRYNLKDIQSVEQKKSKFIKDFAKNLVITLAMYIIIGIFVAIAGGIGANENIALSIAGLLIFICSIYAFFLFIKTAVSRYKIYIKIKNNDHPVLIASSNMDMNAFLVLLNREIQP